MNEYPGGSPHQRVLKTLTAVGTKSSSVVSLWLGTSPACHPVGPPDIYEFTTSVSWLYTETGR